MEVYDLIHDSHESKPNMVYPLPQELFIGLLDVGDNLFWRFGTELFVICLQCLEESKVIDIKVRLVSRLCV